MSNANPEHPLPTSLGMHDMASSARDIVLESHGTPSGISKLPIELCANIIARTASTTSILAFKHTCKAFYALADLQLSDLSSVDRLDYLCLMSREIPIPIGRAICSVCAATHSASSFFPTELQKPNHQRRCKGVMGMIWLCPRRYLDFDSLRATRYMLCDTSMGLTRTGLWDIWTKRDPVTDGVTLKSGTEVWSGLSSDLPPAKKGFTWLLADLRARLCGHHTLDDPEVKGILDQRWHQRPSYSPSQSHTRQKSREQAPGNCLGITSGQGLPCAKDECKCWKKAEISQNWGKWGGKVAAFLDQSGTWECEVAGCGACFSVFPVDYSATSHWAIGILITRHVGALESRVDPQWLVHLTEME